MCARRKKSSHQPLPQEKGGAPTDYVAYRTGLGEMLNCPIETALQVEPLLSAKGRVNLAFTSPPFPLVRKKKYGNKVGEEYLQWIGDISKSIASTLAPDGSLVMEIGNSWEQGRPVMSTLPIETLLAVLKEADLVLCQQFICHNPARLPGPAQWVNIERIRVKDSFTHVWWMAKNDRPKANNRRVLAPYGKDMKRLLKNGKYNAGERPSGHQIGEESFLADNGGAIPPSVLEYANTSWNAKYRAWCKYIDVPTHPARMSSSLAEFFIKFLTDPGDLVFDPFAGSNTSGAAAEALGRKWLSVELNDSYVRGSQGRFQQFWQEMVQSNDDAADGAQS